MSSHPQGEPTPVPPAPPAPPPPRRGIVRGVPFVALLVAGAACLVFLAIWAGDRATHSRTEDAFVEAHMVNIAPQMVSGRIIRVLVDENDRVVPGQVLAEVDPIPYQDKVDEATRKLEAVQAELRSEEAALDQTREQIPIQVEISKRSEATAVADRIKAEKGLLLTREQVEKGIDEARASVKAAKADLTLAREEYGRFTRLYQQEASTQQRAQQVARSRDDAEAQLELAEAKLALALAGRLSVEVADAGVDASKTAVARSTSNVSLSETGYVQLRAEELKVEVRRRAVDQAREGLRSARHDLDYTRIRAPFPGVVVKRYRNLGDFVSPGASVLSMYNPDLIYVEANLEETRLPGVEPGNPVEIRLDAFDRPFRGRVLWINKSTGAEFALMPRNVVSGEFTHVVQRVAVRIWIDRDDRWEQLRSGLSARVVISHGGGDPDWAARTAREMQGLEARYNLPADPESSAEIPAPPAGAERP